MNVKLERTMERAMIGHFKWLLNEQVSIIRGFYVIGRGKGAIKVKKGNRTGLCDAFKALVKKKRIY